MCAGTGRRRWCSRPWAHTLVFGEEGGEKHLDVLPSDLAFIPSNPAVKNPEFRSSNPAFRASNPVLSRAQVLGEGDGAQDHGHTLCVWVAGWREARRVSRHPFV
jgi:hypothetical protein